MLAQGLLELGEVGGGQVGSEGVEELRTAASDQLGKHRVQAGQGLVAVVGQERGEDRSAEVAGLFEQAQVAAARQREARALDHFGAGQGPLGCRIVRSRPVERVGRFPDRR